MKSSLLILVLISTTFISAQEKTLITANLGVVQHAGTGFGSSFSTVRFITDRLAVSLSGGYYKWNKSGDTQGHVNYNRNRKITNHSLVPFSVGGRYYFGHDNINPYFGLEWGLNVRKRNYIFEYTDYSNPDYPKIDKWSELYSSPFASFGLEFGVMLGLIDNFNFVANMRSIWGDGTTFTFFNTGLVYSI